MASYATFLSSLGLLIASNFAFAQTSLSQAFKDHYLIGTSLNASQFAPRDARNSDLIAAQFNAITPENAMKWDALHPRAGVFRFDAADRYVEFGVQHHMFIVGHTLIWHEQTPLWVFQDEHGNAATRDVLLERMREHIHTVVGRYKGRIKGWDVVNEALEADGRLRDSPWRKIIGDDYIVKAFQFAHEADPDAELCYNDYGIENKGKRDGAIRILKSLQAAGAHITGVGIQEHVNLKWPAPRLLDEAITALGELRLKVMITELDVDVLPSRSNTGPVDAEIGRREKSDPALNPYVDGLPDDMQQKLAKRYAELFAIYLKHPGVIERVTFWGVMDGDSWLNDFPIKGRTAHPLLFDREARPKPAYRAVIDSATSASRLGSK